MFDLVEKAQAALEQVAAELEPARLAGDESLALVRAMGTVVKVAEAICGMAALQVDATGAHRQVGDRSSVDTVAKAFGIHHGTARRLVETAAKVAALPATEAALRAGRISMRQAQMVADAVAVNPCAEEELLDAAEHGIWPLRNACIRARAAVESPEERSARQHRNRSLRWWTDDDGMVVGQFRLAPEVGGPIVKWFADAVQKIYRARPAGQAHEPHEAYAADVFAALVRALRDAEKNGTVDAIEVDAGGGRKVRIPVGAKVTIHILVDHAALVRGAVLGGETCEIAGVGPVNVEWVRSLLGDAFLTAVIRNGNDIRTVAHLGRHVPSELLTALTVSGRECCVAGCGVSHYLELDHDQEVAKGGPTSWDNLGWLCYEHHKLKSNGWQLGPRDPVTRKRRLVPPGRRRRSDAA